MKLWAKAALSAALLALLFLLLPWAQVRDALVRLPPAVWLGVLAGFAAGHAVGIAKWRLFVNSARAGLGWRDATLCYAAGLFANLCLPSIVGGDVLRLGLAARFTRRPEAALWGGIMDRISDLLALALLVTTGGLLARRSLQGWLGEVLLVVVLVVVGLLVLALPLVLRRPLARWPRRLRRPIGRSLVGLRQLARHPRPAAVGLALSLLIQSSFVLLNAWLGRSVGIEVSLAVWFLIWPLAKIASLLPISLGGLAVREASLAALLLPFGVPLARSVVCSLLWQTVLIAGGLLGGLLWLGLNRSRRLPFRASKGPLPA
ncbi:MAG TPA: lysylphosphatidylglycerol synthase transmembrane domain-containing protein [Gemmatimonadales bacterium]|nr:lysylphosphatidylglycerol synthase transmembrane domain-containing protein [Gemmatimonadales bacterium]